MDDDDYSRPSTAASMSRSRPQSRTVDSRPTSGFFDSKPTTGSSESRPQSGLFESRPQTGLVPPQGGSSRPGIHYTRLVFILLWKKIFSWNIFRKDWTLRTYCITLRRQFMKPSVFRVHKKRDQPLSPAVFCEYLYMRKCSTRYLTPFLPPVKKTTLFSFRDFFVGTTDTIWMQ
jgi:hypothetical protein